MSAPNRSLSQWQLIRKRFVRHRLAVVALIVIIGLYMVALLAEFVAPYPADWRHLPQSHCPPQPVALSFTDGLHVPAVIRHISPVTYKRSFHVDTDHIIELGFFVSGEPYRLCGLIPMRTHLFGVDHEAYRERYGEEAVPPTWYFFGADEFGRDIFSRIIHGSRISLSIGLVAIIVTFVLGLTIGGISGYLGGMTDTVIQRFIEIINSFPHLPLWLALSAALPVDWPPLGTYFGITILLALLTWTGLARVVRGKILALREEDYAVAARLLGASHRRILFVHLLPGFMSHIIVSLTLAVPGMIIGETMLSFLGLGLRPPVVSWGVLLQDCIDMQAVGNYPWLLLPIVFIVLTVLSFNFLGDGLRDAADPYASK